MTRFSPDRRTFFDSVYQDVAPWDVGRAQPALIRLVDEYPPAEPVLDVGCGTGDLAIALARRGLRVLGIDLAEAAVEQARARAMELEREIEGSLEFRVADALRPSLLAMRFGAVVDSGFLHVFESKQRDTFARELAATLEPGGRYYLLAFAVEFPVPNTPLKVTKEELSHRFNRDTGWRMLALRPAEFLSRMAPVPAVAACLERLPLGAERTGSG